MRSIVRAGSAVSFLVVLTSALTACGGGGGGGGSSGGSTRESAAVAPVTSVPAPTYAAQSAEAGALNYYNAERLRCGFGMLAQSAQLDTAAQNHGAYISDRWDAGDTNNTGHTETAGLSGFTGVTPADRVRAAGYSGAMVAEGLSYSQSVLLPASTYDRGATLMRMLLAVPYHAAALLNTTMEVGVGYSSAQVVDMNTLVINNGSRTVAGQKSNDVVTFPCEGSEVRRFTTGENPDPWVGSGWTLPYGPAMIVRAPGGQRIHITSVTVTGGNVPIETRVLDIDSDPQHELTADTAAVLIRQQLVAATSYMVTITGTIGSGTPFSRQFTFTAVD